MPEPVRSGAVGPKAAGPEAVEPADASFDAQAYAACTAHHRAHDEANLTGVPWAPGLRVVDLGCGVGDLTEHVADLVAAGDEAGAGAVLGIDVSADQVARAQQRTRPGLGFRQCRAQELDRVVPAGWADVVLSVAALHWVVAAEQPTVYAQVARALAPGGRLRLDQGGVGQLADTRAVLDEVAAAHRLPAAPWFFPDEATVRALLDGAGLVPELVELRRQERPLPDADALERWLRSQVLPGYLRLPPAGSAGLAGLEGSAGSGWLAGSTGSAGSAGSVGPGGADTAPDAEQAAAFAADAVAACRRRLRRRDGSYAQHYVRLAALARRLG